MDVNSNPLARMLLGAVILAAAGWVFVQIGTGRGGTWGCFWTLAIIGAIFFFSGMVWYFWHP